MRFQIQHLILCTAFMTGLTTAAWAQGLPRVVTDILPVHSLVSQVMKGAAAPDLLLDPGADPHNQSLRPSQAASLETADVVFLIGPRLTPWLERPLDKLASDATIVALLDVDGTKLLEFRDAHGHGHDHEDDIDPHAWLDPQNAKAWLTAIAETLAQADPERAALYRANAQAGLAELTDLDAELQTALEDMPQYGVHHDAYQYFEARFGLSPAFVIKQDDVHQPGPARIAKLRAQNAENPVSCVFIEPLANRGIVETVLEGSDAQILELDPMGLGFEPGADHYAEVLRHMLSVMEQCR